MKTHKKITHCFWVLICSVLLAACESHKKLELPEKRDGISKNIDTLLIKQDPLFRGSFHLSDWNLKSSVEMVRTCTNGVDEKSGAEAEYVYCQVLYFDRSGLLQKMQSFNTETPDEEDSFDYHYENRRLHSITGKPTKNYEYDDKGRLIQIYSMPYYNTKKEEAVPGIKTSFEYDDDDFIAKQTEDDSVVIYAYNHKGDAVRSSHVRDNWSADYVYEYDANGNAVLTIETDPVSKVMTKIAMVYSAHGDVLGTELSYSDRDDKISLNNMRQYDQNNNWVLNESYNQGQKYQVERRLIQYY